LDIDQPRHTGLEARIADIVSPSLEGLGYELVRVAVMGRERPTVQLMIDRADGQPIGIADCQTVSTHIGAVIDVADPMHAAWTLEVSSPGIDRPLTRRKDWNRYAGHQARVELEAPDAQGRKRLTGIVMGADEVAATLRLPDGSDAALPLGDIRRAKLLLTDALIAATQAQPN
jgi:ribosome maturation factor RimP